MQKFVPTSTTFENSIKLTIEEEIDLFNIVMSAN